MAILRQIENSPAMYQGWYGTCENNGSEQCEPFALITGSGPAAAYVHESISHVYLVSSNMQGTLSYAGGLPSPSFLLNFQTVKQLECGKCYRIVMKPGSDSLDIPEFTFANAQNDDPDQDLNNRVTNRCYSPPPPPAPSPDPTPTTTPTPTLTPTQTILPTPSITPTVTPTPTTPVADICEGYNTGTPVGSASITHQEVRFYTFPDGGHICFGGATGGLPRVTMIRLSGNNTPEGRAVVAGTLLNNNIKYIKSTGQVYQGTFFNNGPFTDLTLQ